MIAIPETVTLPLQMDEHGAIHVSGTRVTLDTLLAFYQQGDGPEALHAGFPTIPLADIYAVIAYYLAHQADVDAYLDQRRQNGERLRQAWETQNPPPSRADLLKRMEKHQSE